MGKSSPKGDQGSRRQQKNTDERSSGFQLSSAAESAGESHAAVTEFPVSYQPHKSAINFTFLLELMASLAVVSLGLALLAAAIILSQPVLGLLASGVGLIATGICAHAFFKSHNDSKQGESLKFPVSQGY